MNIGGFEIERKFLVAMPEPAFLAGCECSEITQTYLLGEPDTSERVRKRVRAGECEYTHTVKRRLSGMRREENERTVGREEYQALLGRADPSRRPIRKTRCCFHSGGLLWELDVFPFWTDRAILEIELTEEDQQITLPGALRIIREVTDDPRYTNSALALDIPAGD